MEYETSRLRLSDDTVYLIMGGPPDYDASEDKRLGIIDECDDAIPDELWGEYQELLDFYQDAVRHTEGYYAGINHCYNSSRGI